MHLSSPSKVIKFLYSPAPPHPHSMGPETSLVGFLCIITTIFAPMIYTAPCIMFWMRAYPLRGDAGGGWALEFSVVDPKLLFRIRYRIRIRPLVSFRFGSGFGSGFESGFESWIRIRLQILDLNPDQKQAKTSFF
jgi:hypothetical protein